MRKPDDGYLTDAQLLKAIHKHLAEDRYRVTKHADAELKNDNLDLLDVVHVLKTGKHDHSKTGLDTHRQIWKYAIEGRIEDARKIRVIIAFIEEMLIITVMEL